MGIRRRRKKLTTILTSVDRRLRSVEFRHVPTRIKAASITAAQIDPTVVPSADPKDNGGTGATSSTTVPSEFTTLVSVSYSSRNITGNDDRVAVVTSTDHNLSVGDKVTLYGLNNHDVNLTGTYVITEVPSGTEFRFKRGLTGVYTSVVNLDVKATVTNKSSTLTEATLTLSTADHGFVLGDVITVTDVDDTFNGTYKISAINAAQIKYLYASAISGSVSPTTSTGYVNSVIHKYAIIGDTWIDTSVTPSVSKIWDGLAWVSGTSLPDGVIVNDHLAPAAPTNLAAKTRGYYDASSGGPMVGVDLTWSAPTTNTDDTPLTDLGGYRVFYKVASLTGEVIVGDGAADTSTASSNGKIQGNITWSNPTLAAVTVSLSTDIGTIYPNTISLDVTGGYQDAPRSHSWEITGLADSDVATVTWSTSPTNSGSGTISGSIGNTTVNKTHVASGTSTQVDISITGRTPTTSAGETPPATPSPTQDGWTQSNIDTIETAGKIDKLPPNSSILFAVQAYDSSKLNFSPLSVPLTVKTGKPATDLNPASKPGVSTRLGTVTITWDGKDDQGNIPTTSLDYVEAHIGTSSSFTPDSTTFKGRILLGADESTASYVVTDLTYGTTYYAKLVFVSKTAFRVAASEASDGIAPVALVNTDLISKTLTTWPFADGTVSTGALADGSINAPSLLGPNVVTQAKVAANAIGANQIAAGAVVAGKIAANAVTANTIEALAITAGKINANAITADKIDAGAITAVKIAADAVEADKIKAGAVTASKILAGSVTAAKILATDTFVYTNGLTGSSEEAVRLGSNAIPSTPGTPGLSISLGGSVVGFVGGWGGGALEIGTDFTGCYIDFYSNKYMYLYAQAMYITSASAMGITATTSLYLGGEGIELNGHAGGVTVPTTSNFHSRGPAFFDGATVGTGYAVNISTSQSKFQYATSSIRYKDNVESIPLEGALDRILALRPVTFNYKAEFSDEPDKLIAGFIAEEVEKIDKLDLVGIYNSSGIIESVSYEKFVVFITLAIQELAQKIQDLSK